MMEVSKILTVQEVLQLLHVSQPHLQLLAHCHHSMQLLLQTQMSKPIPNTLWVTLKHLTLVLMRPSTVTSRSFLLVSLILFLNKFIACADHCSDCSAASSTTCTACAGNLFLHAGECRSCPTGYFGELSTHTCIQCDAKCSSCSSSGVNLITNSCNCKTSANGGSNYIRVKDNTCVATCAKADGYYLKAGDSIYCYSKHFFPFLLTMFFS